MKFIKGDVFQHTDSVIALHTEYGIVTISRILIVEPTYLSNQNHQIKNASTVTLLTGDSFDGEQVSSTDSTVTFQTSKGYLTVVKSSIKNIRRASFDNRHLFLGNTFRVTLSDEQSFEGMLISSTDSSETYRTNLGDLTVLKINMKRRMMTVCNIPFDNKFLRYGDSFKITMLNGDSFDGVLLSSTDSTITFERKTDSATVLKKNVMMALNVSLDNHSLRSVNSFAVVMRNKEAFYGNLMSATDSTATYQTGTGNVMVLKRNILADDNTFDEVVSQIKRMNYHLPAMFNIYAGVAIPIGSFSETSISDGAAKTGFTIGAQYVSSGTIGYWADIGFSSNSTNTTTMSELLQNNLNRRYGSGNIAVSNISVGSWSNILLLAGGKIGTESPFGFNVFFAPVIGLDYVMSPQITGDVSGKYYTVNSDGLVQNTLTGSATQASAKGIAFMYGATVEMIVADLVTVNARYLTGTFNYNVTFLGQYK